MATDDWFAQQGAPTGAPPDYQQAWQQGKIPGSPGYQAAVQQNPNIDPQTGRPWQALTAQQGAPGGGSGFLAGDTPRLGITDPGQGPQLLPGQAAQATGIDSSWWNPQDPQGSVQRLLAGKPPTSQTLLSLKPQFDAVGIQISPANAEGVTSKINIPGVGWTRVLDQAVADPTLGGRGTGWVSVVQPNGGAAGGAGGGGGMGGFAGGVSGTLPALGAGAGLWDPTDPTGQSSLANLAASTFQNTPGYQARLNEGLQALQRSAAAKGTLLTGGTGKALERYGQDYASGEYEKQYNRLLGEQTTGFGQRNTYAGRLYDLANLGQQAAGQTANLGATYSGQAGTLLDRQANLGVDLTTGAGNAQAAGTIGAGNANAAGTQGRANAWNTGLNLANNAAQNYYLSRLMNPSNASGATPNWNTYGTQWWYDANGNPTGNVR